MATPDDYREHGRKIAPMTWGGIYGSRFIGAHGLMLDALAQMAVDAVRVGMLASYSFSDDAADYRGAERRIRRHPGETAASYKARIENAFEAWQTAGSDTCIIARFAELGMAVTIENVHTWDWDGDTVHASRFWVRIPSGQHSWTNGWTIGATNQIGAGLTIGLSGSPEEFESLRRIVRTFKAGEEICAGIIVELGSLSAPDGTWDRWENRDTDGRYVAG